MTPLTLAILFFSHLLQCRIMSLGRQCRAHWYTCTLVHVSDETATSVIRVVRSQKTAILYSLSEEPQFSLVSFNFRAIKFT